MYNLIIKKQAKKKLQSLSAGVRARIVGLIQILSKDPDDRRLDIKNLQGEAGYRLRAGQWRVIFERDDVIKVISIEKIGARGDIYK